MTARFPACTGIVLAAVAACSCMPAAAAPLTITNPFFFRDHTGPNPVGLPTGDLLQLGAFVSPSGPATTVTATQGAVTRSLTHTPHPIFPDDYESVFPYDASLSGPWQIDAANGGDTASATTGAMTDPQFLPLVSGLRVVPNGTTPTLVWDWPDLTGFAVDAAGIRAIDADSRLQRFSSWPSPTAVVSGASAQFTIPAGALELGHAYIFRIGIFDLRNDGSTMNRSATFTQTPYRIPEPGTAGLLGMVVLAFCAVPARARRASH